MLRISDVHNLHITTEFFTYQNDIKYQSYY